MKTSSPRELRALRPLTCRQLAAVHGGARRNGSILVYDVVIIEAALNSGAAIACDHELG
jgi:hypothetical protein